MYATQDSAVGCVGRTIRGRRMELSAREIIWTNVKTDEGEIFKSAIEILNNIFTITQFEILLKPIFIGYKADISTHKHS